MSQSQPQTLETQTIHLLLSNDIRRAVVCRLQQVETTTAPALGRHVTDSADDSATARLDRRTATIALIHNHLPRLETHDVVEYDRSETTVTHGPTFGEIESFLDQFERNGDT